MLQWNLKKALRDVPRRLVCHAINVTGQLEKKRFNWSPTYTMNNASEPSRTTYMLISGQRRVCKLAGIIFVSGELAVYIAVIKFSTLLMPCRFWCKSQVEHLTYCVSQGDDGCWYQLKIKLKCCTSVVLLLCVCLILVLLYQLFWKFRLRVA